MIKDLQDGREVIDIKLLVVSCSKGIANSGQNYLNILLQDFTGQIDAKLWNASEEDAFTFTPGNLVVVDGDVLKYKDKLQLKIDNASIVDPKYEDLTLYVPASKFTLQELTNKYKILHDSIKDKDYLTVLDDIIGFFNDDYENYPAAVKNHHAYSRGLMTHSISVAEICEFCCSHYDNLNHDLLITSALLHDIGKIIEFSSPLIPKYTVEGTLVGHISIGNIIVHDSCVKYKIPDDKRVLLEHMILSHHGQMEFGSPVRPMTAESMILSQADDLDAKQSLIEKTLQEIPEGEFSQRIFALDDRVIYKPFKNK